MVIFGCGTEKGDDNTSEDPIILYKPTIKTTLDFFDTDLSKYLGGVISIVNPDPTKRYILYHKFINRFMILKPFNDNEYLKYKIDKNLKSDIYLTAMIDGERITIDTLYYKDIDNRSVEVGTFGDNFGFDSVINEDGRLSIIGHTIRSSDDMLIIPNSNIFKPDAELSPKRLNIGLRHYSTTDLSFINEKLFTREDYYSYHTYDIPKNDAIWSDFDATGVILLVTAGNIAALPGLYSFATWVILPVAIAVLSVIFPAPALSIILISAAFIALGSFIVSVIIMVAVSIGVTTDIVISKTELTNASKILLYVDLKPENYGYGLERDNNGNFIISGTTKAYGNDVKVQIIKNSNITTKYGKTNQEIYTSTGSLIKYNEYDNNVADIWLGRSLPTTPGFGIYKSNSNHLIIDNNLNTYVYGTSLVLPPVELNNESFSDGVADTLDSYTNRFSDTLISSKYSPDYKPQSGISELNTSKGLSAMDFTNIVINDAFGDVNNRRFVVGQRTINSDRYPNQTQNVVHFWNDIKKLMQPIYLELPHYINATTKTSTILSGYSDGEFVYLVGNMHSILWDEHYIGEFLNQQYGFIGKYKIHDDDWQIYLEKQWVKVINTYDANHIQKITELPNGELLVVGVGYLNNPKQTKLLIYKLSTDGEIVNSRSINWSQINNNLTVKNVHINNDKDIFITGINKHSDYINGENDTGLILPNIRGFAIKLPNYIK